MSAPTPANYEFVLLHRKWSPKTTTLFASGPVYGVNLSQRFADRCVWNIASDPAAGGRRSTRR